jgi:hypothetical protein
MLASNRVRWIKAHRHNDASRIAILGALTGTIGHYGGYPTWGATANGGYVEAPFYHRVDAKRWVERQLTAMSIAGVLVQ